MQYLNKKGREILDEVTSYCMSIFKNTECEYLFLAMVQRDYEDELCVTILRREEFNGVREYVWKETIFGHTEKDIINQCEKYLKDVGVK